MNILDTEQIRHKIEVVVNNAKTKLILISPYIMLWDEVKSAIYKAVSKKVQITIIYRNTNDERFLNLLKRSNIYVLVSNKVHAKIYMNEKELLITSMNLYKYSSEHNYEIGFYTTSKKIYKASYQIVQQIIDDVNIETFQPNIMSEVMEQTAVQEQKEEQNKVVYNKMELRGYVENYKSLSDNKNGDPRMMVTISTNEQQKYIDVLLVGINMIGNFKALAKESKNFVAISGRANFYNEKDQNNIL